MKKQEEEEQGMVNGTWQECKGSTFTVVRLKDKVEETAVECMVNSAVNVTQGLLPTEVLLDNQANISIIHPMLLYSLLLTELAI
jgi:hypothetical protein